MCLGEGLQDLDIECRGREFCFNVYNTETRKKTLPQNIEGV